MFFMKQFNVLAVDDEPDMLAVIKMALRNITVSGLPIHVETASSKAEAIEVLDRYAQGGNVQELLSVVFLDVVMETNTAGLEVADYIRNTQKNFVSQIYIVTGQPGVAPEKEVIDKYDISGYVSKPEADEAKLYSLVRSGIRAANTVSNTVDILRSLEVMFMGGGSREALRTIQKQVMEGVLMGPNGERIGTDRALIAQLIDGEVLAATAADNVVWDAIEHIRRLPGRTLEGTDTTYIINGAEMLLEMPGGPNSVPAATFMRGSLPISPLLVRSIHQTTRSLATLWFLSR